MPQCPGFNVLIYFELFSGRNLHTTINVRHLPPLSLIATLPPEYPTCGAPRFTLGGTWLSRDQLNAICGMLDQLWETSPGMPILYTWIDWIENSCLRYMTCITLGNPNVNIFEKSSNFHEKSHNVHGKCHNVHGKCLNFRGIYANFHGMY